MNNSSREEYYSNFKHEFQLESYLLKLKSAQRVHICKLRVCNIKFPIKTGRWQNIPRDARVLISIDKFINFHSKNPEVVNLIYHLYVHVMIHCFCHRTCM